MNPVREVTKVEIETQTFHLHWTELSEQINGNEDLRDMLIMNHQVPSMQIVHRVRKGEGERERTRELPVNAK